MRFNSRKLIIGGGSVLIFVWIVMFHNSMVDIPNTIFLKNNAVNIDSKLDILEKRIDKELIEAKTVLEEVRRMAAKFNVAPLKSQDNRDLLQEVKGVHAEEVDKHEEPRRPVLPVLVIACNRVTVERCLKNLVKYRPSKETFPIIVSQDCGHEPTYNVIKKFVDADTSISVVRQPDLSEIVLPKTKVKFRGYYKIARHFKFALNYVFKSLGHEAVIIVEDDLDISPDFFEYFLGTYPVLQDPSIWCISAWNDNGKKGIIDSSRPELLHRTDFFPGLGWLLKREMWIKLEPKWPPAFFDDWLRNQNNTDGRACIRPEISRTYSFGKVGVSKGLFFDNHLRHISLNTQFVDFTKLDLRYLFKEYYDPWLIEQVESAKLMTADEVKSTSGTEPAKVLYSDAKSFQNYARKLGLMDDFRSGIPRTAYKGIVQCFVRGRRVYLAPSFQWTRYDPHWG